MERLVAFVLALAFLWGVAGPFPLYGEDLPSPSQDSFDALVATLAENLGIDTSEFQDTDKSIYIRHIRFHINGTTRESWARSRLFIKENHQWQLSEWQRIARLQADYFLQTGLFYNAVVYLEPSQEESYFDAVVELTDGFMYTFNFWPWDVSVGIRHLLRGNEFLEITGGLTTQRIFWSHPIVAGSPFSYALGIGHSFREKEGLWLEESYDIEGKCYLSLSPALDVGSEHKLRRVFFPTSHWLSPDLNTAELSLLRSTFGLGDTETVGLGGLFLELWPVYQFMQPLGYHARVAGGFVYSNMRSPDWYGDVKTLVFIRPWSTLVAQLFFSAQGVGCGASPLVWPDVTIYRSSHRLSVRPGFLRTFIQVTYLSLISIPLGFTRCTVNPYVFLEGAGTFGNLQEIGNTEFEIAGGAAVAFGFLYPVNLYFSLGVQQSLRPYRGMALLFSVQTNLY